MGLPSRGVDTCRYSAATMPAAHPRPIRMKSAPRSPIRTIKGRLENLGIPQVHRRGERWANVIKFAKIKPE
jgi:hypothetical protein